MKILFHTVAPGLHIKLDTVTNTHFVDLTLPELEIYKIIYAFPCRFIMHETENI